MTEQDIIRKMRQHMITKNWTIERMARELELHPSQLSRWLNRKNKVSRVMSEYILKRIS